MRCIGDFTEPELAPDFGGRIGQDGISERGDDADGFGGGGENARLQLHVRGVGAVLGLFPGRVGGQIAVGFGNEEPQTL